MTNDPASWGEIGQDVYRDMLARRGLHPTTTPQAAPRPEPDPYLDNAQASLAATIPARFATAQPDHPQVTRWVREFNTDPRATPSMLLAGPPGVGKTWQMLGALRAVVTHAATNHRLLRYRMVTHPALNDELRPKTDGSHEAALDAYLAADLLLLDDLGAGRQTEWAADCLYRLVDHRWFHGQPTLYATNLDLDELEDTIGNRVMSRVCDSVTVLLDGPDRRAGVEW